MYNYHRMLGVAPGGGGGAGRGEGLFPCGLFQPLPVSVGQHTSGNTAALDRALLGQQEAPVAVHRCSEHVAAGAAASPSGPLDPADWDDAPHQSPCGAAAAAAALISGSQDQSRRLLGWGAQAEAWPMARGARGVTVDVPAGAMLYLPCCWLHAVRGSPALNVTANYWCGPPLAPTPPPGSAAQASCGRDCGLWHPALLLQCCLPGGGRGGGRRW